MKRAIASTSLHLALLTAAALTLVPLLWMFSASVMPTGEANQYPPRLFPSEITFANYRELFTRLHLGRAFGSSLLVATVVTLVSSLFNAMAGYAFAKLRFKGRDRLFRTLVLAMVIPTQVAVLPLFLLLRQMSLVGSYLGVMLPTFASIFGIFLVRQYARSIPDDLLDAARLDGAKESEIFFRFVLPLCRPILVTLALFTFLGTWNDFLWPLVVLSDERKYTLPVALASLSGEHVQDTELMMAGSVVTVLPVLVLFFALQRAYIEGITQGGVKE